MARNGRCVKSAAPHLGHCRYNSAGSLLAEIELISLANSARSTLTLLGAVTEIPEIDRTRRRAADRGTRHVYPHLVQFRSYSFACHGNLTRSPSLPEPGPRARADGTASLLPPAGPLTSYADAAGSSVDQRGEALHPAVGVPLARGGR